MPTGVYTRKDARIRFWGKVKKLESGCWQWLGATINGYGCFKNNGTTVLAHRLAFNWIRGLIPDGFELDHLCRNHACVNPEHLEIVTTKVNVLRGIGVTAINSRATQCPRGHPYDLINTYMTPDGRRDCRSCRMEAQKRWQIKQMRNIEQPGLRHLT